MNYWLWFCIAGVMAAGFSLVVMYLARRWQIVDDPHQQPQRKQQIQPVPLLGGWAIYLTVVIMILWLWPNLTTGYLLSKQLLGIILAGGLLMVGGTLDDVYGLLPRQQIIFPVLASIIVVAVGIGTNYITNPFGGILRLDYWKIELLRWHNLPYYITILADLFTIGWLLITMYTTKLLDGLDGLVPGITVIGGIVIFLLSISPTIGQPETGTIALVLAGSAAGFLVWNFSPAKIYLGEGGALLTGFMLGILAIVSGGKIATTLFILGLPMIDVMWVVIRRVYIEHTSPFAGDTLHLHYQLRLLGMSDRSIALAYYLTTLLFGLSTLWFSGITKLVILGILWLISVILLYWVYQQARTLNS